MKKFFFLFLLQINFAFTSEQNSNYSIINPLIYNLNDKNKIKVLLVVRNVIDWIDAKNNLEGNSININGEHIQQDCVDNFNLKNSPKGTRDRKIEFISILEGHLHSAEQKIIDLHKKSSDDLKIIYDNLLNYLFNTGKNRFPFRKSLQKLVVEISKSIKNQNDIPWHIRLSR